jgi:hypothetical protein
MDMVAIDLEQMLAAVSSRSSPVFRLQPNRVSLFLLPLLSILVVLEHHQEFAKASIYF